MPPTPDPQNPASTNGKHPTRPPEHDYVVQFTVEVSEFGHGDVRDHLSTLGVAAATLHSAFGEAFTISDAAGNRYTFDPSSHGQGEASLMPA